MLGRAADNALDEMSSPLVASVLWDLSVRYGILFSETLNNLNIGILLH